MANQGGRYEVEGGEKVLKERTDWDKPKAGAKGKSNQQKEVNTDAVQKEVHPSKN